MASPTAPSCAAKVQFFAPGTFLERADNTARILDVKYHILLPSVEDVGGALDHYQAALLRSVSSFETHRTLYRTRSFRSGPRSC